MNKSIDQVTNELQAPFGEEVLEFRVGATNEDKTSGLALPYVEVRAIQNRLDKVLGINNWRTSYREVQGGFICCLSLRINGEWISKEDGSQITDYESLKGGISSAFKRVAASGWGIGRYLYNVRNQWFPIRQKGKGYEFMDTPKIDFQNKGFSSTSPSYPNKETYQEKLQSSKIRRLTFGKYRGKTLEEVHTTDPSYFKYLTDQARDQNLRKACRILEQNKSN